MCSYFIVGNPISKILRRGGGVHAHKEGEVGGGGWGWGGSDKFRILKTVFKNSSTKTLTSARDFYCC